MKMVRSLLLAGALSFGLAACSSTGQLVNPVSNGTVDVSAVQNAAVTACGYLPAASTVADIIAKLAGVSGPVSTAESVASSICAAVVPAKSGKFRGTPHAYGVAIHGRFVR